MVKSKPKKWKLKAQAEVSYAYIGASYVPNMRYACASRTAQTYRVYHVQQGEFCKYQAPVTIKERPSGNPLDDYHKMIIHA